MTNLLELEEQNSQNPNPANIADQPPVLDPEVPVKIRRGANWFYWIAALSVINSAAFIMGANFHFLAGLGLTEIADTIVGAAIERGAPASIKAFSVVFDLIVVICFAIAGYFANKNFGIAFIVGTVVYLVDGVIVLLLGDLLMAAFHAFALFGIIRGLMACRELKAFTIANLPVSLPPPPPVSA